jgi:hypothetical protein
MEAFLDRFRQDSGASAELAGALVPLWRWWNGLQSAAPAHWPDPLAWRQACTRFRGGLSRQPDLASALMAFARDKALPTVPAG